MRNRNVPDVRLGAELRTEPGIGIDRVVSDANEESSAKARIGSDRPTPTAGQEGAAVHQARDRQEVDAPEWVDLVGRLDG